ncbi:hypothetical protein ABZ816_22165 [Actinosynnema sp. NPDC047251]|uniref:Putative secreted protein n=1 Tax=Saccharothrix espanaensis (strain ATCC 51144 / DSM 44229 / JCM 9112 / NBRC 15066 / NRRL 15764) TaxID=1179773 RepID=K0KAP9_SACES|nr:hypothetical protein [Saccharothrix espanaensis]CCH33693.1 putative secreted protein [Saccharothrix espanaensis DSM 44229]
MSTVMVIRRSAVVGLIGVLAVVGALVALQPRANADNAGCGLAAADYSNRLYHGFVTDLQVVGRASPVTVRFGTDGTVRTTILRQSTTVVGTAPYTLSAGTVSWNVPAVSPFPQVTFASRDRGCDNSSAVPRSIGGVTSDIVSSGEPVRTAFTLYRET